MEEKIFVGYNYGRFETKTGEMRDYCNAFMLEEFGGEMNKDYCFGGQKAVKYSCTKPEVWKNCEIGQRVKCWFDSKQRISYMEPVTEA